MKAVMMMKMKLISLSEILAGKFELVLQIDDSVEKLQISIFESKEIWGIQGLEFEKILWKSGYAKENQKLIADIKQKYLSLKKTARTPSRLN